MSRYRVTAVTVVHTSGESDSDAHGLCELERASVQGFEAIKVRDVVEWRVEKVED